MSTQVEQLRRELRRHAESKAKQSAVGFFKESIKLYGVITPVVRQIAKAQFKLLPEKSRAKVWPLCEELWQSGYLEEAQVAANWSYALRSEFEPGDFKWFEKWVSQYVHNWAACDTFCNHTLGAFMETYPDFVSELKKWAKSKNRWLRRAASVTLIVPAKDGKFLQDVYDLADLLLEDADDMVQKGYGWLLKVAANRHEQEVFQYVMKNKARMPRTALRYAIEKMPENLRQRAMA
jgi:3-methyladenine DNA glycosylase AlkD